MRAPLARFVLFLLVTPALPAEAQRALFEAGVGTLAPDDPFLVTLAFRASAGINFGGQNALTLEYSRQSANRTLGNDVGKYARQLVGLAWQHAFGDVFSDPEPKKLQYLMRLGGGALIRGTFPAAVGDQDLRNAAFADAGVVIRYPLSARVAAIGTVEDAIAFLPAETVQSYCTMQGGGMVCYPEGGSSYFTIDRPATTQHNLGVVLSMQVRL
ncbi:MAG TPA: hypothetical protein VKD28_16025 [Gemmatimonadales bacterium]|nr:hypothetical protein [Gemmatimonadales bacterium]